MNALEQADAYTREARSGVGRPYHPRYRKRLRTWWMRGWRGEPGIRGSNYDRPLENAHRAGRRARKESKL